MIKLMKHCATDGANKVRVHYSRFNRASDGRECVTIYAKTVLDDMTAVFGTRTKNNSDVMSDYFECDRVVLFPGDELWDQAVARTTH